MTDESKLPVFLHSLLGTEVVVVSADGLWVIRGKLSYTASIAAYSVSPNKDAGVTFRRATLDPSRNVLIVG